MQLLTFWMAFFHMLICCFHLILGLRADRHPGCWTGLTPAPSCGARLAPQVCTAPAAVAPVTGYLNRYSHNAEKWWSSHCSTSQNIFCFTYGALPTDFTGFEVSSRMHLLLSCCPSSPSGFQLSYRWQWWAHHLEPFPFPGPFLCCRGGCPDPQRVQLGEIRTLFQASSPTLWVPNMPGLQWVSAGF